MPTDLQAQKKYTVQDAARQGVEHSVGLLFWLANAGQIIDPWWSKNRDAQLRNFWKDSDHFSGAVYMMSAKLASVPRRVEPRDATVKAHIKAADVFQSLLDESPQFVQGWTDFWTRFYEDLWCSDNGAFGEVIGDGDSDGPIKGPPVGLVHLDSYNCQRTSDPEFPVIYTDTAGDGKRYKFHYSRVIYAAQMPSAAADMYGVGFCWLSRAINVVQNLKDISVYKQEKLGSRPLRAILTGAGINTQSLIGALAMAEEGMDNQGLSRYAKTAVVASTNPQFTLDLVDLAGLPDGFDEKTSTELAMLTIALTGGFPPRWLWPATQTGATKADAMYSHIAGSGGGANWHLDMMTRLLGGSPRGQTAMGGKFLPPYLRLVFDYQDDEQDRLQADIKAVRAERRKTDIEDSVITVRVAREQALSDNDLTRAQFEQLELDDGNLPDGESVLTLYSSLDPFFIEYLDLGTDDPLAIDANDPLEMLVEINEAALNVQDVLANSASGKERKLAQQAQAALSQLKEIYEQISVQNMVTEQQTVEGQAPQPGVEEQEPETEEPETETETEEEVEEKGFNFGAKVGETIAGSLARGEGGRFANAAEVAAARNELLAGLIARLRAKRGGGDRGGVVAARKEANRAKIGEVEGVGGGTVDALAAMRTGDPVEPGTLDTLQKRGLAQVNADGSVTMSTAGRKLLTAANTGDVDKAKKALADAAKPGKGGKGGKPKKDPKQEAAQMRNQTFTEVAERIGADAADMTQLHSFSEGGDLVDQEMIGRLTKAGFVERDSEGNLRMTSAGRSVLSAASKGDTRKVLDAASRARDKIAKRQERQQAQAAKKREQAAGIQSQIEEATEQLAQIQGIGRSEQDRQILQVRIEQLQAKMDKLESEADELEAKEIGPFEFKAGGTDNYRRMIRSAVRGLWKSGLTFSGFWDAMSSAINIGLTGAWRAGARECGVNPDEFTQAERAALEKRIQYEHRWITGFAEAIEENRRTGGKLASLYSRAEIWIGRWDGVRSEARAMACADRKLKWVLGSAQSNCNSCIKLDGKVKRGSFWAERSIFPRIHGADYLECQGFRCTCSLVETDEPLSKGPLPNLP